MVRDQLAGTRISLVSASTFGSHPTRRLSRTHRLTSPKVWPPSRRSAPQVSKDAETLSLDWVQPWFQWDLEIRERPGGQHVAHVVHKNEQYEYAQRSSTPLIPDQICYCSPPPACVEVWWIARRWAVTMLKPKGSTAEKGIQKNIPHPYPAPPPHTQLALFIRIYKRTVYVRVTLRCSNR